ncbi:MAG TPA: SH3 domain-containing protein [Pyrinomonadaceae bacterium]|nr:SH3 domain-containing protein [Pyrinomonadaceae bacterium]
MTKQQLSQLFLITVIVATMFVVGADAQRTARPTSTRPANPAVQKPREIGATAVVLDETLSVLRSRPSLFADVIQRMRRGRKVQINGVAEADGVRFYRVAAHPSTTGWVQSEAVFGQFRTGDDMRLARLVYASSGFEKLQLANAFFELFPRSGLRPSMLLLYGDLIEETSVRLSRDANARLNRHEMAATEAPMHSYYLNFNLLDRYRRLGIVFLFNPNTRTYHYEGASWREITSKFSSSSEADEARKRLDQLREKMGQTSAKQTQPD